MQGEVEYPVPPLAEPEAVALSARARSSSPRRSRGALRAPRQPPARGRARRGADEGALPGPDPRAPLAAPRPPEGRPDADPRQQTLRATIEWSYDLLVGRGAAALRTPLRLRRRLHARGGGAGLRRRPRHAAVARREEPPALHERALLDARDDPGVRGGAAELSATLDSLKAHAEWVLRFAEQAELEWTTPAGTAWFKRLNDEIDNVRAAIE